MITTKSIQLNKEKSDGIRICIMREPAKDSDFDIWIPDLAPSREILTKRHQNLMTFEEHRVWFKKNVLINKSNLLKIVVDIAKKRDVTLLCWELDPNTCHRKWVLDEIKILHPSIEIKLQ